MYLGSAGYKLDVSERMSLFNRVCYFLHGYFYSFGFFALSVSCYVDLAFSLSSVSFSVKSAAFLLRFWLDVRPAFSRVRLSQRLKAKFSFVIYLVGGNVSHF